MGENRVSRYRRIDWDSREQLAAPQQADAILILDAADFPPEGDDCDARLLCRAFELGWRQFHLLTATEGSASWAAAWAQYR